MKECFRILGLSDNATKEQVKAAYEHRVMRYKGSDYADEPEYAQRKIAQLKKAYEEASRLAKDGTGHAYAYRPIERKSAPSQRKTMPSLSGRIQEKDRSIKEKIKKPDLGKIKEGLRNLTEDETTQKTRSKVSDSERNFGDNTVTKKNEDKNGGTFDFVKAVISLLIIGITFFGSCGGEFTTSDYDYIDEYEVEDIAAIDQKVSEYAIHANNLLYEQEFIVEEYEVIENDEDFMKAAAEEFAWEYWGMSSIEEVSQHLYDHYGSYMIDSEYDLETQLESILAFYDFPSLDEAVGHMNPFTKSVITNYTDLLWFLNGAIE